MSAEAYKTKIEAAVTEDPTRSGWTVTEWRAYFLAEHTDIVHRTMSADVLVQRLGLIRTQEILSAIKTSNEYAHTLLIEGRFETSLGDALTILRAPLTNPEKTALNNLLTKTGPRHVVLGLPDPRERLMNRAIELLGE